MALNPKQAAFVREYLVDLNATQAAIRVGYSPKTAKVQGSRLLTNVAIKAAVEAGKAKLANKAQITIEEILAELKNIGFSDPALLVDENGYQLPINKMPPAMRRCIASIEMGGDGGTKIKFWPKNNALELLGKHLSAWTDKTEITGAGGGPVNLVINGVVPE